MNNNIKSLYKLINNKYIVILSFVFVLFYKNGFSSMFNGLPFSNKYETITFLIIFPVIIIFNHKIFTNSIFKSIVFILLFVKFYYYPLNLRMDFLIKYTKQMIIN